MTKAWLYHINAKQIGMFDLSIIEPFKSFVLVFGCLQATKLFWADCFVIEEPLK